MATCRIRVSRLRGSRGISLVETLITALVVTIVVIAVLQFTGQALLWHEANQATSRETLALWNKGRALRRTRPDSEDIVTAVPGARPLYRFVLKNRYGCEWEVLCAEK